MINSDQLALMKTAQLRKKKAGIEYICYFRQRYIQIFQSCSRNLSGSHAQVRQPWERSLTQCRTPISWFWDGASRPRASLRDETECWEQATSDRLSLLRKSDKTNSSQEFLCGTDFWLALNRNNTKRPGQKYQRARFEPRVWQRRGRHVENTACQTAGRKQQLDTKVEGGDKVVRGNTINYHI